jgi:phosphoribosylformylglycinamidine synthase
VRPRVAVIQFPGSNCEHETARALTEAGLEGSVHRWNEPSGSISGFDAYVLPGGFSYQDRVRAGAVAAKDPVMDVVSREASSGTPVLGICNGAQILVESGMVPGWTPGSVECALASNLAPGRSGYYSGWVFVKPLPGFSRSPWLSGCGGEPFPLPVAHAEGRFLFREGTTFDDLESSGTPALAYCAPDGGPPGPWPGNPNGSSFDIAGILDPGGRVLAMMPHPERARWLWQVPPATVGPWGERRRLTDGCFGDGPAVGPGAALFASLAAWLGAR